MFTLPSNPAPFHPDIPTLNEEPLRCANDPRHEAMPYSLYCSPDCELIAMYDGVEEDDGS